MELAAPAALGRNQMTRRPLSSKVRITIGLLSVALLAGFYFYLSYAQHCQNPDDTTIPTITQLWAGLENIIKENPRTEERWILVDSESTFMRLFIGLGLGILGSVALGIMMGCFRFVEAFFIWPLSLLAKIPPTAALAVFFVMVGTGTEMYIAMIGFGVLPTLAQTIYISVKEVPSSHIDKGMTFGATTIEIITSIIFGQILPRLIDSIRLQIGPAMVYLIAAEMVCGDMGFGYRIRMQSRLLNMSVVYPYLAMLALFGFAMDSGLRKAIGILCPWYVQKEGGFFRNTFLMLFHPKGVTCSQGGK